MKRSKKLSIFLYVFVVLSLIYTCYMIFSSYSAYTQYYGTSTEMTSCIVYVIQTAYSPLIFTIILYALAEINDIFRGVFFKEEADEKTEESEEKEEVVSKE